MKQKRLDFRHILAVVLAVTLCMQSTLTAYAMDSTALGSSAEETFAEGSNGLFSSDAEDEELFGDEGGEQLEEEQDYTDAQEPGDEGDGPEDGADEDPVPGDETDPGEDPDSDETDPAEDPDIIDDDIIDEEEAAEEILDEEVTEALEIVEEEDNLLKETKSGTCGKGDDAENVTWSYDTETKVLTIDGTGAMADYSSNSSSPYSGDRYNAKKIVIGPGITAIGSNAFRDFSNVTEIEIADSPALTSIGDSAFRGCQNCESFSFPQSLETIGDNSFDSFHKLTSFTAPATLVSIGKDAFRSCNGLTTVDLSDSSAVLNTYSFAYCSKLATVKLSNDLAGIPEGCFDNCTAMTTIDIPGSVTSIGTRAFAQCRSLQNFTFPVELAVIGSYAFFGCSAITTANIPGGVLSIKNNAFRDCTGLTTVVIPASATTLENNIFYGCSSLSSATLNHTTEVSIPSSMFENCTSLTQITLPASTTSVENYAFKNSGLTSIVIPENVTKIGYEAFKNCSDLASVTLPENYANSIQNNTFESCGKLTAITLPANTTEIGSAAFKNTALTGIIIPANVKKINGNAFEGCSALKVVTFEPDSLLTDIGSEAFKNCTSESFTEITIPKSVKNLNQNAFNGCTFLAKIIIEEGSSTFYDEEGVVYKKSNSLLHIVPPGYNGIVHPQEGITELTTDYYKDNTTVTTAYVPSTVITIKSEAFRGCTSLQEIIFCTSDGTENGTTALKTIESNAFRSCTSLTEIEIPATVTNFGTSLFEDCTELISAPLSQLTLSANNNKLPNYTFYNCQKLTEASFPAGVTAIGYQAFYNCKALTSVTIPETVTGFDANLFEKCSGLTSANIPAGVTKIPNNLFLDCSSLATVTSHDGITEIGNNAFKNCALLTGFEIPAATTKIDYNAFDGCSSLASVSIPSGCTTIGTSAFARCTGLTTVTYDDACQITKIQSSTFEGCTSLTSVDMPATVTEINSSAFKNCSLLPEITLSSGLTRIDSEAFRGCSSLDNVVIPDGVVNLNQNAFNECTNLSKIRFTTDGKDGGNANYYSSNDIIYKRNGDIYIKPAAWDGEYDLSGIEVLTKDYYKGNTRKTSINIPKNIKTIGDQAFMGCTALETVTFESGSLLTAINSEAFRDCTSLKNIVLPSGVITIGNSAFRSCTSLTSFVIPNSVTTVGEYAFQDDTALATITIGSSVTELKYYAFYHCTALKKVTIPASVTTLGSYVFSGCTSLDTVTFAGTSKLTTILTGTFSNTALTKFNIPASVTEFYKSAFDNCNQLATMTVDSGNPTYYAEKGIVYLKSTGNVYFKPPANGSEPVVVITTYTADDYAKEKNPAVVTIPKTVTTIDSRAFRNADKLTTVKFASGSRLTAIGNSAFFGCTKLKSIALPNGLLTIGEDAFYNCDALTSVTLPSTLVSIGAYAFQDCDKLSSVKFPASLTTIGEEAYSDCDALKAVIIPVTVTNIGAKAFRNCGGITTVTVNFADGATVGNDIFYYCSNLATATVNGKMVSRGMFERCEKLKTLKLNGVETINTGAFKDCRLLTAITLPATVKTIKLEAFAGSYFKTIVLNSGLTTLEESAFKNCTYLTEIKIPQGITTIPANAFSYCTLLKKIYIPASVTSMAVSAFTGCTSLEDIIIDKNNANYVVNNGVVYSIGEGGKLTFFYCPLAWNDAEKLIVPDGTTSIPAYAFKNNETIVTITIPASVTSIGEGAFQGCKRLRIVNVEEGSLLREIGAHAFEDCFDLNRLTFTGDTVLESIGTYAFDGDSDLVGIFFDNNTKEISLGNRAFYGNTKLKGLYNGSGQAPVSDIGLNAFYGCSSLEYLRLGNSVSSIGSISTFYGCSSLKAYSMDGDSNDYCYVIDGVLFLKSQDITVSGGTFRYTNVLYNYPMDRGEYSYTIPDGTGAIGNSAFQYDNYLENVNFPDSVGAIDDYAFDGARKLTVVTNLKMDYINLYAFRDCVQLLEVDLSDTELRIVQPGTFYRCNALTNAVLPETVVKIGNYGFGYCYNMVSLNLPDTVTSVGEYAFYDCTRWENVKVPAALEGTIGEYAYYYCNKLETMTIPAGVTGIGAGAFYYCYGLKDVTFEEGSQLTSIGEYAFCNCSALTNITVPEGVTYVGGAVFLSCSALEEISLPSTLTSFATTRLGSGTNDSYNNYAKYGSYLIARDPKLRRVVVKNASQSLPTFFYFDSTRHPEIYIYAEPTVPDGDGTKDSAIKTYCRNYSENFYTPTFVELSKYDTDEDPYISGGEAPAEKPVEGYFDCTVYDETQRKDVPNRFTWTYTAGTKTLTVTGSGVLDPEKLYHGDDEEAYVLWHNYYNEDIEEVVLDERIIGLGTYAFSNHYALREVTGTKLSYIGPHALRNCSALVSIDLSEVEEIDYMALSYCRALTEVNFGDALRSIGNEAFYSCTGLEEVIIPEGVTTIQSYAFESCSGLVSASVPGTVKQIPSGVFSYCSSLTDLTINEGVEIIGSAFYGCISLETLNLPVSLTQFDANLVSLTNLKTINVAEGGEYFKSVDGCLYRNDNGVWTFVWGDMSREIEGEKVFYIKRDMTNVDFTQEYENNDYSKVYVEEGNEVYKVVNNAIYSVDGSVLYFVPGLWSDNDGLFEIAPGTRRIGEYALANCSLLTGLTIPDGVSFIGRYAFAWSGIRGTVTIPEGVTGLENYTFNGCKKIAHINLPATLTSIGSYTFNNCSSLQEINIPDTVTEIGQYAFYGCNNMKTAIIPGSVKTIPADCFYECNKLEDLRLSKGIEVISDYAFAYCKALQEVTLPEGLKRLDGATFYACNSLYKVSVPSSVEYIYLNPNWYKSGNTYYSCTNSFYGCDEDLVLYGERGSYAEEYAQNGLLVYYRGANYSYGVRVGIPFNQTTSDKYHITYMIDTNAGEFNHPDNPTSYRTIDRKIALLPATKEGYTFDGWYADRSLTQRITEIVASFDARQLVLYPKFLKNLDITIKAEGLPDRGVIVPESKSFEEAGITYEPVEGKQFAGYVNEDGSSFDTSAPVYGEMTVTALYADAAETIAMAPVASVKSGEVAVGTPVALSTVTEDADIFYTFGTVSPVSGAALADEALPYVDRLIIGADNFEGGICKLNAVAVKGNSLSKVVTYTYTKADTSTKWGEILPQDRSRFTSADEVPAGIWVVGVPESTSYTGSKITFDVRVYYGTQLLQEKTDYTATYKNNLNVYALSPEDAGFAANKAPSITIKGKGNYKDNRVIYFEITPVTIMHSLVNKQYTVSYIYDYENDTYYYYGGDIGDFDVKYLCFNKVAVAKKAQKLVPEIIYNGMKLKAGKDFTVEYAGTNGNYTTPGNYYLTVTGKGNYVGVLRAGYIIADASVIPMNKVKISGLKTKVAYTGAEITQDSNLTLSYTANKQTTNLVKNTDYTITTTNNKEIGTATITIKGMNKYIGTVTKTFKITGTPITKAKVKDLKTALNYDGKAKYQADAYLEIPASKTTTAKVLKRGVDYTVTYQNNVNAGKATVIYTGKGAYTGSIKKTFKIVAYETKIDVKLKRPYLVLDVSDAPYAKGGVKPHVSVTYKGKELTLGKDYTLSVKNNKKVYLLGKGDRGFIVKQAPTAVVRLKGNFKGTLSDTFRITTQDLSLLGMTAGDVAYADKPGNFKTAVAIKDLDGKVLKAGTDYDKDLIYTYAEAKGGKQVGARIADTDKLDAGTVVRVTAKAVAGGAYTGSIFATYRIAAASIAKAGVAVKKDAVFTYTGSGLVPGKSDLIVTMGGVKIEPADYEIISCTNNVKTGKATITIKGKGPNYCGTKSATFSISQKSLAPDSQGLQLAAGD